MEIKQQLEVIRILEAEKSGESGSHRRNSRRQRRSDRMSESDSDTDEGDTDEGAHSGQQSSGSDFGLDSDVEQEADVEPEKDAAHDKEDGDAAEPDPQRSPAEAQPARDFDAELAVAAEKLQEVQQVYEQAKTTLEDWNLENFVQQMKKLKKSQRKLQVCVCACGWQCR